MASPVIPLSTHLLSQPSSPVKSASELAYCMEGIALAGKRIARDLRKAGLCHWLGSTGQTNIQGEEVQQLDQRANDIFLESFENQEQVSAVVSEELERPFLVKKADGKGGYALFIDPLDGSSNVDVNAPLGSIFSFHRLSQPGHPKEEADLLKPGKFQVAAGYVLYGPSVVMVYTSGSGVFQFCLDPEVGEFFLTASQLNIPARGKLYSTNEGNCRKWVPEARGFVEYLQEFDPNSGRPYSGRYSGCLVADVHRILLKGGLYLYPAEVQKPEGKLRLMYEAAPLTFVIEQAGGVGSTGAERVRELVPEALHQRVPLYIGSRDDVVLAETYHRSNS